MDEFSRKPTTKENLDELQKRAQAEFFKIGLVVDVDTIPCLIVNPDTMETSPPIINIQGRVPGSKRSSLEEGFEMLDHEKKRFEIIESKTRNEAYLGQKGKT